MTAATPVTAVTPSTPVSGPTRVAVLTIVAGRHDHLRGQLIGLGAGSTVPQFHVVAAMGDPGVAELLTEPGVDPLVDRGTRTVVVDVPVGADGELPLARARNAAAQAALDLGADLLVLLDVDCVPSADLLALYVRAAAEPLVRTADGPALLCGPVSYLPPDVRVRSASDLAGLPHAARPHPARPAPGRGDVVLADAAQWWLFWSLSFAVTADDWRRLGGFCEEFRGYGGEDTDVAATAKALGGSLFWVGGADAYHQHHPTRNPPVQHVESILRNAEVFHRRWGWYPMEGWLEQFRSDGLLDYDATSRTWSLVDPRAATARNSSS